MYEIFTRNNCVWCDSAKNVMKSRSYNFVEKNIETDHLARAEFKYRLPTARSVPQIFLDGTHIGNHDDFINSLKE